MNCQYCDGNDFKERKIRRYSTPIRLLGFLIPVSYCLWFLGRTLTVKATEIGQTIPAGRVFGSEIGKFLATPEGLVVSLAAAVVFLVLVSRKRIYICESCEAIEREGT